ncbi:MAG: dephospho-CoA kinase [Clostridia bacterium]|nr:dephospho-CoA kinase [Clostridia bacterium]
MIVGLTGGTGTGKTSISKIFEKSGYKVINYDLVTRQIYSKGSRCLNEVVETFGKEILTSDGELDRRKLGEIVFSDKNSLDRLNKIVYKYILSLTAGEIEKSKNKKLLLDAPTLFESGLDKSCDVIVGVVAKKELRLNRVAMRDGLLPERVQERINSQKPDEFYFSNCDYVIENNGSYDELAAKVEQILSAIDHKSDF